jgi:hypothetical protein
MSTPTEADQVETRKHEVEALRVAWVDSRPYGVFESLIAFSAYTKARQALEESTA